MDCEFAVIGAGPAGSSAARLLAQRGASVLLFEKQRMPRRKLCGGALSAQGMRWLGISIPNSLIDRPVFGLQVHYRGRTMQARMPQRVGVLVERASFDHYLVQKAEDAGARMAWEEVVALETRPTDVLLVTRSRQYAVRCAIVCEGANRRLGRLVSAARPEHCCFCLEAHVPVADTDPCSHLDGLLDIHFGEAPCGYAWVFHHGTYYSVGIAGLHPAFREPLEIFQSFVRRQGLSLEAVRPRGHFVPWGGVRRPLCADRVILAGDAAGVADPFTCEGIAYAVRGGQLAAETVLELAEQDDFSRAALLRYEARCWEAFGKNLRHSLFLTRLAHAFPPVVRLMLSSETALRRDMLTVLGESTYRRYTAWLVSRAPWLSWQHITAAHQEATEHSGPPQDGHEDRRLAPQ